MLAWDNTHYLPDDLLFKMDIASMAHGLEVRSPFLDHELVEMCAALPADWKGDARQGKRLLRDIVAADLPPEILAARKRGFSVPLSSGGAAGAGANPSRIGNLARLCVPI
jgi:asparagine synthase (glutamine-hydrolysing)